MTDGTVQLTENATGRSNEVKYQCDLEDVHASIVRIKAIEETMPPNGLELSCGVTNFPHHIPNYASALAARKLILTNFLAGSEFALPL